MYPQFVNQPQFIPNTYYQQEEPIWRRDRWNGTGTWTRTGTEPEPEPDPEPEPATQTLKSEEKLNIKKC